MKKNKFGRIIGSMLVGVSTISIALATVAWFASAGGKTTKHLDGEVGLRGYFYTGDGSSLHPFEIVNPIHFYNLTRLQNLGLFLNDQFHFQVGHNFGTAESPNYACINSYKPNGEPNYDQFLDMGDFVKTRDFLPIGGEGAPFIGHFNGNGIPIKNLIVSGYPEDIGVFGYVSYGGIVEGLVCDNLTIRSLGYSSQNDDSNLLFSQDIDYIFEESAAALAKKTKLHFFKYDGSDYTEYGNDGVNGLTKYNGLSGTPLSDINKSTNMKADSSYFNGFFVPEFPKNEDGVSYPFTYSWRSSSGVLKEVKDFGIDINDYKDGHNIGKVENPMVIDINALRESEEFNAGTGSMQVDARLSLIASIEIDGFVFSRVIQSYTCEFYSNGHSDTGWLKRNNVFTHGTADPANNSGSAGDYYYRTDNQKLFYKETPESWSEIDNNERSKSKVSSSDPSRLDDKKYEYYIKTTTVEEAGTGISTTYYDFYIRESLSSSWAEQTVAYESNAAPDNTPGSTGDYYIQHNEDIYNLFQKKEAAWVQIDALLTGSGSPVTNKIPGGSNDYYIDTNTSPLKLYKKNSTDFFDSTIYCDYTLSSPRTNDYNTNYHHGNNIGFLAGHVDGTIKQSYVYNGKFEFNNPNYEPIDSESETGLIGEIGTNVVNSLDPDYGLTAHGDTGVMNFSNIYKMIRNKASIGSRVLAGSHTPTGSSSTYNWVSYNNLRNSVTFERFKKYLTHSYAADPSMYEYIISADRTGLSNISGEEYSVSALYEKFDSVDFLWNQIIEDEDGEEGDRGLGVFKVVTSFNSQARDAVAADPENYYYHMYDNFGDCVLKNKLEEKTKVYFSTAEYDFKENQRLFGGQSAFNPSQATTFPVEGSYDSKSFKYPFSRDFDYSVEFDLTQLSDASLKGKNYLYNTSSVFLKSYLSTKLVNKFGFPIDTDDPRFGFMFKSSMYEDLTGLSSYMSISHPEGKNNFQQYHYVDTLNSKLYLFDGDDWNEETSFAYGEALPETPATNYFLLIPSTGKSRLYKNESSVWTAVSSTDVDKGEGEPTEETGTRYYPSNSIVFRIENERGANVSVVGNGSDITIFKNPNVHGNDALEPLYKMKATGKNDLDRHRYFSYDAISGATSEEIVKYGAGEGETADMKDSNGSLYAHIFLLPQGDYVIGAANANEQANIYFLAVQGQTEGTIGANDMAGIGNAVTDVDFLLEEPTYTDFHSSGDSGLKLANLSFKSTFNTRQGDFTVEPEGEPEYLGMRFTEGSQTCVTYLLIYAYSNEAANRNYYVNGVAFGAQSHEYNIHNTD